MEVIFGAAEAVPGCVPGQLKCFTSVYRNCAALLYQRVRPLPLPEIQRPNPMEVGVQQPDACTMGIPFTPCNKQADILYYEHHRLHLLLAVAMFWGTWSTTRG